MNIQKRMRQAQAASERAAKRLTAVGMPVILTEDFGDEHETVLTQLPWQLGHGAWVCGVESKSGGYDCARIRATGAAL